MDLESWDDVVEQLREGHDEVLSQLGGRFAIALIDREQLVGYLITDRLGQYPLYIATNSDTFAFSSSQASFCLLYRLGKLVTMELVLRLSDAGWRRTPLLREH